MSTVADITVSVDGFVTGPDPGPELGLGVGGEALHRWAIDSDDPVDAAILRELTAATGAVVMGRRLFDIVDGPQGWDDTRGYGAGEVGRPPWSWSRTGRPPRCGSPMTSRSSPPASPTRSPRPVISQVTSRPSSWEVPTSYANASMQASSMCCTFT